MLSDQEMIQNIRDKNGRRLEKYWSLKSAFKTGFLQPKLPSKKWGDSESSDNVSENN